MFVFGRHLTCAALLAILLGGCTGSSGIASIPYGENFRWMTEFGWTEETILRHGWADAHVRSLPPDPPKYCYRTLAAPECFESPLPGQESRLVGYVAPPPKEE